MIPYIVASVIRFVADSLARRICCWHRCGLGMIIVMTLLLHPARSSIWKPAVSKSIEHRHVPWWGKVLPREVICRRSPNSTNRTVWLCHHHSSRQHTPITPVLTISAEIACYGCRLRWPGGLGRSATCTLMTSARR